MQDPLYGKRLRPQGWRHWPAASKRPWANSFKDVYVKLKMYADMYSPCHAVNQRLQRSVVVQDCEQVWSGWGRTRWPMAEQTGRSDPRKDCDCGTEAMAHWRWKRREPTETRRLPRKRRNIDTNTLRVRNRTTPLPSLHVASPLPLPYLCPHRQSFPSRWYKMTLLKRPVFRQAQSGRGYAHFSTWNEWVD